MVVHAYRRAPWIVRATVILGWLWCALHLGAALAAFGSSYLAAVLLNTALRSAVSEAILTIVGELVVLGATLLCADLVSGIVHWIGDAYGHHTSVHKHRWLYTFFFESFSRHHDVPFAIYRSQDVYTTNLSNVLAAVALYAPVDIYHGLRWGSALAWPSSTLVWRAFVYFTTFVSVTNQFHRWAHVPVSEQPPWMRSVFAVRLVLSDDAHRRHHRYPEETSYCITTGWCNNVLDAVQAWRRLESVVYRCTGLTSWTMQRADHPAQV
jgi:ubiquitin-conjugating enzyme E2 variant